MRLRSPLLATVALCKFNFCYIVLCCRDLPIESWDKTFLQSKNNSFKLYAGFIDSSGYQFNCSVLQ